MYSADQWKHLVNKEFLSYRYLTKLPISASSTVHLVVISKERRSPADISMSVSLRT